MAWVSSAPVSNAERLPLVREGLAAWFAEDYVKAIHVLVPQVEAAVRELLSRSAVPSCYRSAITEDSWRSG